jgi:hypothetical protein
MVRYRGRGDRMKLAVHPRFLGGHALKFAAIKPTFSFPVQVVNGRVLGHWASCCAGAAKTLARQVPSAFSRRFCQPLTVLV